jgi:Domain of unknown function DUF302
MAVSRQELAGPLAGAAPAKWRESGKPVTSHLSVRYEVTRLVFDAGQPYDKFRGRYEAAVPPADPRPGDCPGRHVRWQDGAADANGSGPHGFVLYWRADMTPGLMGPGDLRPCTAYLMGHHAIAEQAYLHDPAVMLYAPLRAVIYIDSADRTRLAVDQPSMVYASFADPVITELGRDLDRQLAGLLDALGIDARRQMGQRGGRRRTSSNSSPSASISASTP